jgi:uncharacterized protein DUF6984
MSNERHVASSTSRPLRPEERDLISLLLSRTPNSKELQSDLIESRVMDMNEGGMGSIRFVRLDSRHFGKELVTGQYLDSDGVLVSISVNADDQGTLFELDFWKVDFSPLKRYPKPEDIAAQR